MGTGSMRVGWSETALLPECPGVYCPDMVKPGQQAFGAAVTLGQLTERLDIAIKVGLGIAGGIIAAAGAVLTWISIYYLPARIGSDLSPYGERLAKIEQKVNDIDENQRKLLPSLLQEFLKKSTAGKPQELRRQLLLAQGILKTAAKQHILSDPQQLSRVGETLRELEAKNPTYKPLIWDTVTQLINYRSALNAGFYSAPQIPGAIRRPIAIKADPGVRFTATRCIFENLEQGLDGGIWKDVIFRNCLIKYDGGSVSLENVYFEDCQFQLASSPKGEKLSEVLLASIAPNVQFP
jgi:hypothetical protein